MNKKYNEIEEESFTRCYTVDYIPLCINFSKCNDANKKIMDISN